MDEKTKQKLLDELRKEYRVDLKPLKEAQFTVRDILEKYYQEICDRIDMPNSWAVQEQIGCAIRKVMCFRYRANSLKEVNPKEREQFRKDFEKFINEFILDKGTYNGE